MANGVTTEWEDIHVKLGNYLPREKEKTGREIYDETVEEESKKNPYASKTDEEIKIAKEENSDLEDDEELKEYERKRMEELKALAAKPKFGRLILLRREDYIKEVNEAPKGVYVVLFLYNDGLPDSRELEKILDHLSKKYVFVKFLKILAEDCIKNIEDVNIPAMIVYFNGTLIRQYIPAAVFFGGKGKLNLNKVEITLSKLGMFKTDLTDDDLDNRSDSDEEEEQGAKRFKKGYANREDSDEDEKDDREYSWKIYRK